MKTLIVVVHPDIDASIVNKKWVEELAAHPDSFTIHELYRAYPTGAIDVEDERRLVESHDALVLQFPLYWFGCPPLLKKWLDEVWLYGWAYGSQGKALKGRKIALAVSAGLEETDYGPSGRYRYSLDQILAPFETTFSYVRADYRCFFAFYGAEKGVNDPHYAERVGKSAKDYVAFLNGM